MDATPQDRQFGGRLWYGEQDENGVDLSLIRENLKLTPLERLRRMEQAAADAQQLRGLAWRAHSGGCPDGSR